ncbi:hypothetical protein [uncultured Jatrophihabitans sp.]|uniref:hypothetical protein n=1 Tax=uncultured Jatrophihabitans sp. TaxID=1610747 RepID=UPI0035CB7E63
MNPHAALRRVGRIEYSLLRTPLGLVDEQVVQRFLGEDSGARQSFERLLDAVDDAARRWLTDPEGEARDAGFTWHGDDVAPEHEETDAPPAAAPAAAPEQPRADTQEAEAEAEAEAEEEEIEELTDELLEQEETETFAGELAEDDELRRVQAELNAKRLVEEQHEDRQ